MIRERASMLRCKYIVSLVSFDSKPVKNFCVGEQTFQAYLRKFLHLQLV